MMKRGPDLWKHDKGKFISSLHLRKYGGCTVRSEWRKNLPFGWLSSSLVFKERWANAAQKFLHLSEISEINSPNFFLMTWFSNRWLKVTGKKIGTSVFGCAVGVANESQALILNIDVYISQKLASIPRLCSHSASWHKSPRHLLSSLSCHRGRSFLCSFLFWHSYGACLWLAGVSSSFRSVFSITAGSCCYQS